MASKQLLSSALAFCAVLASVKVVGASSINEYLGEHLLHSSTWPTAAATHQCCLWEQNHRSDPQRKLSSIESHFAGANPHGLKTVALNSNYEAIIKGGLAWNVILGFARSDGTGSGVAGSNFQPHWDTNTLTPGIAFVHFIRDRCCSLTQQAAAKL